MFSLDACIIWSLYENLIDGILHDYRVKMYFKVRNIEMICEHLWIKKPPDSDVF